MTEKYSKYKRHTADTFVRLLVAAAKAKGVYDASRHDSLFLMHAPLFVRLEECRCKIAEDGLMLREVSREGNIRYVRNPLCDLELQIVAQLRSSMKEMGLFDGARRAATPADALPSDEERKRHEPLDELTRIIAGITPNTYKRKPLPQA